MHYCDSIWSNGEKVQIIRKSRRDYWQILSQASPSLNRILQATEIIPWDGNSLLFKIHLLLNFSWAELRTTICPLRSLISGHMGEPDGKLSTVALDLDFFPSRLDSLLQDLTSGSLRVIRRILKGELERYIA
jgi:hypothetical protein